MILLFLVLLVASSHGLIPPDGTCVLNILLPFTATLDPISSNDNGQPSQNSIQSTSLQTVSRIHSIGFFHMASALMAMEHFNARNASVIPEVTNLTNDCFIQYSENNVRRHQQFWICGQHVCGRSVNTA
jgi:hypothetical protein